MKLNTSSHLCRPGVARTSYPAVLAMLMAGSTFFLAAPACLAQGALQAGDVVAICGDSITEQKQYSVIMEKYLLACQPELNLSTVQFGWSGERAPGFVNRIQSNVLPFKPTVATTCYGMNDGGYSPVSTATVDTYRRATQQMVKSLKDSGVRFIVVGGPGIADPASYNRPNSTPEQYNITLKTLSDTAKEVAQAQGVQFADVFRAMDSAAAKARAKYGNQYKVAPDGVHPTPNGHLAMAYAFLKALGCKGDIGTITVDFAGSKVETDAGQKVKAFTGGELQLVSSRYPYVLPGEAGNNTSQAAMAEFLPFTEELNRYNLVVKNAPARTKVTWGSASKEFTAAQLAAGINLAAEFPVNPFAPAWSKLEKAIQEKQNFETPAVKSLLNSLPQWETIVPSTKADILPLKDKVLQRHGELRASVRAAVVPVEHTIRLEAAA